MSDEKLGITRLLRELLKKGEFDRAWQIRLTLYVSDFGDFGGVDAVYLHNGLPCVGGGPLYDATEDYPVDWEYWNPYKDERGKCVVFSPCTGETKPLKRAQFEPVSIWFSLLTESVWLSDEEWDFVRVDTEGLEQFST